MMHLWGYIEGVSSYIIHRVYKLFVGKVLSWV